LFYILSKQAPLLISREGFGVSLVLPSPSIDLKRGVWGEFSLANKKNNPANLYKIKTRRSRTTVSR
ncbi:MAG: hypothetical protein ACOYUZ_03285, partial [Patescibacteria group bacterium]